MRDEKLIEEMHYVRKIVELGLAQRKELQIKVKQPLAEITVSPGEKETKLGKDLEQLIRDELNVKKVSFSDILLGDTVIKLDTKLTDELIAEGQAREIVRKIQEERKKIGTNLDERVTVSLESWPSAFEEYIKQQALVKTLTKGEFEVKRL